MRIENTFDKLPIVLKMWLYQGADKLCVLFLQQ